MTFTDLASPISEMVAAAAIVGGVIYHIGVSSRTLKWLEKNAATKEEIAALHKEQQVFVLEKIQEALDNFRGTPTKVDISLCEALHGETQRRMDSLERLVEHKIGRGRTA